LDDQHGLLNGFFDYPRDNNRLDYRFATTAGDGRDCHTCQRANQDSRETS
jgi:hypothetical protein